jgi:adenylate kinase
MGKSIFYLGCLLITLTAAIYENSYASGNGEKNKPLALVLFGPPGCAPGVLGIKISKAFTLPLVSTADLVHDHIKEETEIGQQARDCLSAKGSIPDSLILQMLYEHIKERESPAGFLLEGLPRTEEQAEELKKALDENYRHQAIYINISDETILSRAEGRYVCQRCGRVYHKELSPPDEAMICDHCGNTLTQREDDSPEYVKKRLEEWRKRMEPILNFYKQQGLLTEVNGNTELEATFIEIKRQIQAFSQTE